MTTEAPVELVAADGRALPPPFVQRLVLAWRLWWTPGSYGAFTGGHPNVAMLWRCQCGVLLTDADAAHQGEGHQQRVASAVNGFEALRIAVGDYL